MIHNRPLKYVLFAMYQEDQKHHKFILLEDATNLSEAYREAQQVCHAKDQMIMDNYGNQYPCRANRVQLGYKERWCVSLKQKQGLAGLVGSKLKVGVFINEVFS